MRPVPLGAMTATTRSAWLPRPSPSAWATCAASSPAVKPMSLTFATTACRKCKVTKAPSCLVETFPAENAVPYLDHRRHLEHLIRCSRLILLRRYGYWRYFHVCIPTRCLHQDYGCAQGQKLRHMTTKVMLAHLKNMLGCPSEGLDNWLGDLHPYTAPHHVDAAGVTHVSKPWRWCESSKVSRVVGRGATSNPSRVKLFFTCKRDM